jgi:gliding motility-associated-like protein
VAGLLPGTYTVTVTDMHSCAIRVSAVITEDSCNDISIYDVITPNGDGVNEVWVIPGLNRYPQNTVQIFDKWGDIVYEKLNYNGEWYGQSRGAALLPDGTYFYLVKLNAPNRAGGDNVFKGTVLIKR